MLSKVSIFMHTLDKFFAYWDQMVVAKVQP
jgi:hypothetical protein